VAEIAHKMVWRNNIRPYILRRDEKINADFFLRFAPAYHCQSDFSNIEALQENELDQSEIAKNLFTSGLATAAQLHKKYPTIVPEPEDYEDLRVMPFNMAPIEVIAEGGAKDQSNIPGEPGAPEDNSEEDMSKSAKILAKLNGTIDKLNWTVEKRTEGRLKNFLFGQRKQIYKIFEEKKDVLDYADDLELEFSRQDVILSDSLRIVYNEAFEEAVELAKVALSYSDIVEKDRIAIESGLKSLNSINLVMKKGIYELMKANAKEGIEYKDAIRALYENSDSVIKE
jgi:hypothetical protein